RRKYLKPLYAELAKTPAGLERARAIYARARPRYHAVATNTPDGIVGAPGGGEALPRARTGRGGGGRPGRRRRGRLARGGPAPGGSAGAAVRGGGRRARAGPCARALAGLGELLGRLPLELPPRQRLLAPGRARGPGRRRGRRGAHPALRGAARRHPARARGRT